MTIPQGARAQRIRQLLRQGYSYTDIAGRFGISRQAIWDFARRHNLPKPTFLHISEAAQLWNCSTSTVISMARDGRVPAERIGSRWHILTRINPRHCVICGKPVPFRRHRYCSQEHAEQASRESHKRSMWRRFHRKLAKKGGPMSNFTDQKPRIATKEDVKAPWSGGINGKYFRCKLCGHRFEVGDYWRWMYFDKYSNILVCQDCDTPNVVKRWVQINKDWKQMKESSPFWWFIAQLEIQ